MDELNMPEAVEGVSEDIEIRRYRHLTHRYFEDIALISFNMKKSDRNLESCGE